MLVSRRTIAVLAATATALLAGYTASADRLLTLAAVVLAAVATGFALAWQSRAPAAALAVLLVIAVMAPVDVTRELPAPFVLTAVLCSAWLVQGFLFRRRFALRPSRLVVATLAFMAVAVVSFIVGQYPWFPTEPAPLRAQVGGLALFLVSGGLLLLVGHQIATVQKLARLAWVFVALGAMFVLLQMVPLGPLGLPVQTLTKSNSVGSMFWVWLVAVSLSQGLVNRTLPMMARFALVGAAGLAVVRGLWFARDWVAGWLPPLIAAGVILVIRFPRTVIGAGLLLLAPALVAAAPAFRSLMAGGESYSWMTRLEAAAVMWKIISRNPWLGFGPANYYHYTLLFPIMGWWVRFNSHNNYIDFVAQVGVIGLAAFVWISFEAGRAALDLARRGRSDFAGAYGVGTFAGLLASLVAAGLADWVVPFAYNIGIKGFRSSLLFWFFLGGLLALHRPSRAAVLTDDATDPWAGTVWEAPRGARPRALAGGVARPIALWVGSGAALARMRPIQSEEP